MMMWWWSVCVRVCVCVCVVLVAECGRQRVFVCFGWRKAKTLQEMVFEESEERNKEGERGRTVHSKQTDLFIVFRGHALSTRIPYPVTRRIRHAVSIRRGGQRAGARHEV